MGRSKLILLFAVIFTGRIAFAQYSGGSNHGFGFAVVCTDLNNVSQGFIAGSISGNSEVCTFGYEKYSVSLSSGVVSSYFWTVPNGASIASGQGSNTIFVNFGTNGGTIQVTISSLCQAEVVNQTVTMVNCPMYFGDGNDGFAQNTNCSDLNGNGATFLLGSITGSSVFCANNSEVYQISLISGTPTWYEWSIPMDASITSGIGTNTITVLFGETNGAIGVQASDACHSISALPLNVTNNCKIYKGGFNDGYSDIGICSDLNGVATLLTSVSISGSSTFCSYGTETYTATAVGTASNFLWTVPEGATIVGGNDRNSILVNFGPYGGNVSVEATSGCDTKTANFAVSPAACPFFNGNTNDGFVLGSTCTNLNGVSAAFVLNPISGPTEYCQNCTETYSISLASGSATTYFWILPSGAMVESGQGSNTVLVNMGAIEGDIICEVSNACYLATSALYHVAPIICSNYLGNLNDGFGVAFGCAALNGTTTALTLNSITGPTTFCPYSSETYSVSTATGGASTFYWTIPDGASIITGQGTNTVNISFGLTGGDIFVDATNLCETVTSSPLSVSSGGCVVYSGGNNDGFVQESGCGDLAGNYIPISLNAISGPTSFCPFVSDVYSITLSSGYATSYYWNIPSGCSIISGQGSNSIVMQYGTIGGDIIVDAYNDCELVSSTPYTISIGGCPFYTGGFNDGYVNSNACSDLNGMTNSLTLSAISGPTLTCINTTENYTISTTSGFGNTYLWSIPPGAIILSGQGSNSITVQFGSFSGNISVDVSSSCETVTSAPLAVSFVNCPMFLGGNNDGYGSLNTCSDLNGIPSLFTVSGISGENVYCQGGETQYSVNLSSGYVSTYFWNVPSDAIIVSGQNTNIIRVRFGILSGNISVVASNVCSEETKTLAIVLNSCPEYNGGANDGYTSLSNCTDLNGLGAGFTLNPISGSTSFCANTSQDYSISLASGSATSYDWTGPTGSTIIAGQGTNSVTILFGDLDGFINVTVNSSCASLSATPFAVTNNCLVYNGGNNDGFSSGTGCGSLGGVSVALTLNSIAGASEICLQSTESYSITPATGFAISYLWTIPSDATIVSGQGTNSILILFGTSTGNISVSATNGCETVVSSALAVSIGTCTMYLGSSDDGFTYSSGCTSLNGISNSLTVSEINGSDSFCPNGFESYTLQLNSGSYDNITWNPPSGGNVIAGQGSLSAIIAFGSSGGTLSVDIRNQCQTINKTLVLTPVTCTMYAGGDNDGYSQEKACSDLAGAGSSFTIGSIVGSTDFCPNGTDFYQVNTSGYVSSFYWTVPSESTIISGQGTSQITVQYGTLAGNIDVIATNNCASLSATSLPITPTSCTMYAGGQHDGYGSVNLCGDLNGTSSTITLNSIVGSSTFCKNATESYSISLASGFANSFLWSVPVGSNIVSGQGSSSIIIQFGSTNGNISTLVSNGCETANSSSFAVTQLTCTMYAGGRYAGFYAAHSIPDMPLPIELLEFNGFASDPFITLQWKTTSEMNSDYFEIEKLTDNINFEPIIKKKAAGMSNRLLTYTAIDSTPSSSVNYYRLKNTDYDGTYSYSPIISVYLTEKTSSFKTDILVYPNPSDANTSPKIQVSGFIPNEKLIVRVINTLGLVIWQQNQYSDSNGKLNTTILNNSIYMMPGIYFISVSSTNQKNSSIILKL